ncbi:MAG TPA: hypothetical protein PKE26_14570 [Kiritimatiellia bacterium]|nr:hypothetical protein [Kiritimatiellia bacterium]HMP00324.1 hypothetical protein [Kiritimatiellia bacterium]HMP97563.1 hypothetical protein [Kiritimatiellia bacterium]
MTALIRTITLLSLVAFASARAHHAMEFIQLESYTVTAQGEGIFYVHYDYMVEDADQPALDHWEITPGLAYGITDRLMIDAHTHFAKFGEGLVVEERREEFSPDGPSPFMEALAVSLTYRLTKSGPIQAAVSGFAEFPFSRAKELLGSEDNVYGGTLILGREFGEHGNVILNLGYEVEGDEDEWAWGVGVKHPLSGDAHGIAAGLEVMGDIEGTRWSVLPGVYAPIGSSAQFKFGIEIGQQQDDDDAWVNTLRVSTAMMVRF